MSEGMNMNQGVNPEMNQNVNQNPNQYAYQQPVTFVNPMQQAPKKPMDLNNLIGWIIRGAVILAELLFFLPLCLVSCSYMEEEKYINGFHASFGFEFAGEKIGGIWWLFLVFIFTAILIALWFVKDLKAIKDFSLKKPILCLLTAGIEAVNVIILIAFINGAKEVAAAGSCELKVTFFFVLLMIIDVLLCLGGAAALVIYIIKNPDFFNEVGSEVKKLLSYKGGNKAPAGQPMAQPQMQPQPQAQPVAPQPQVQPAPQAQPQQAFKFCSQCGARLPQETTFCTQCGNKCN